MEEESSARAAMILMNNGFSNATPLEGGLNAWIAADYPLETSDSDEQ